jgi:hypothetical protein
MTSGKRGRIQGKNVGGECGGNIMYSCMKVKKETC